jgi:5-methylcytosine-specific restriction endonuclease McrA
MAPRQEDTVRESTLETIFDKTGGHCHFCCDRLRSDNRGWAERMRGHWEVDHVIQRLNGGSSRVENLLPACTGCNRLRKAYTGKVLRNHLLLGIIAAREIRHDTGLGDMLRGKLDSKEVSNERRRQLARL